MLRWIVMACVVALVLPATVGADEYKVVREKVGEITPEISFDFRAAKFADVTDYISKQSGCNIVVDGKIDDNVTLRLVSVKWREALDMVCQQIGAVAEDGGNNIIRVSKPLTVSFELEDASLSKVICTIAKLAEATVIIGPNVKGVVTAQFYDVPWTQALNDVVRTNNYVLLKEGKAIRVMDPSSLETQLSTRVFQLRYMMPPETYSPVVESKYVKAGKGVEAITGIQGAGEIRPVPGLQGLSAGGGTSAGGGASSSASAGADFPLLNAIQRIASVKGRVDYVPSTNALIVTDTEPNIKAISELIDTMDKEPLQVFIDVKFVSTNLTNQQNRGVNWAKGFNLSQTYGKTLSGLPFSLGGEYLKRFALSGAKPTPADIAAGITDSGQAGPFEFGLLDFTAMTTVLEMMASDQDTELKQSPQLLVLDNHQATIFVGETVRYAQTDSASNQAGGVQVGIKEADHSPIDTGFQLWVRPHIVAGEDKIMLTVIPKAEQLSGTGSTITGFDDFTNGTSTIQLPRVQSSTLVTQMMMKSGQTAILGGMIHENVSKTEHKVPILGDIPIIGWAFKWKSDLKTKTDLLVFLSVYIVRNESDVKQIYTVYGSSYGGKEFRRMETDKRMKDWYAPKEKGYDTDMGPGDTIPPKPSMSNTPPVSKN